MVHTKTMAIITKAKHGLPKGTMGEVLFMGASGIAKIKVGHGTAYLAPNEFQVMTVKGMSK